MKTELVARTEQYDALCGEMAELELKEVELNGELKDKVNVGTDDGEVCQLVMPWVV